LSEAERELLERELEAHVWAVAPPSMADAERLWRRGRRRRTIRVASSGLLLAALFAAAVVVPLRLTGQQPLTGQPSVVRDAGDGYELVIPKGWRLEGEEPLVLVSRSARIEVRRVLVNLPDPSTPTVYSPLGGVDFRQVEQPFQRQRRSDGRSYLVEPGGAHVLAWPAYCPRGTRCSVVAPYRGLLFLPSGRGYQPTLRRLVEQLRPIGNALPNPKPTQEPARLPAGPRHQLGITGRGADTWKLTGYDLVEPLPDPAAPGGRRAAQVWIQFDHDTTKVGGTWQLSADQRLQASAICPPHRPGRSSRTAFVLGVAIKRVAAVRIELAGQPPHTVPVLGRDTPLAYAAFVSPALDSHAKVRRLVPLNDAGRAIGPTVTPDRASGSACRG
jgi:hypothetical protein